MENEHIQLIHAIALHVESRGGIHMPIADLAPVTALLCAAECKINAASKTG